MEILVRIESRIGMPGIFAGLARVCPGLKKIEEKEIIEALVKLTSDNPSHCKNGDKLYAEIEKKYSRGVGIDIQRLLVDLDKHFFQELLSSPQLKN